MITPEVRIAFWGTPSLTTVYLDALQKAGLTPVVIITNPDRPKGRGQEIASPDPKVWGLAHDVAVLQPEKLDDEFYAELSTYGIGLSIVVAYGSLLPQRFIDLPTHATLNVHYSLLPRYRGASPVETAVLSGDTETGASIQIMARALDSGPIIAESTLSILPEETAPELRTRLTVLGAELLAQSIPAYISGQLTPKVQDESLATSCGKMRKEDGCLDLRASGITNYRKYRAYFEWPRTYFFIDTPASSPDTPNTKLRVIIKKAHLDGETFVIDRVLPEGKKEMSYEDFKRGNPHA
jgi:methionyl-tRNA formyltransferase